VKETTTSTANEYVDRGPRVLNTFDDPQAREPEAGELRIPKGDGMYVSRPPYTHERLREIVQQGRKVPRHLSLEESRRVRINRGRPWEQQRKEEE
jgi:hypothetical protein